MHKESILHRLINNSRFLLLPWVRIPNLASHVLALAVRAVTRDGEQPYGVRPWLVETLVDTQRFSGHCYRVANWWCHSEFATEGHTTPEIGRNRFSRLKRQGISPTRRAHVSEALRDGCRYLDIHESLSLPAITLNDCWTIDTYGGDAISDCLEALR